MPFVTEGKTNLKYILIVVILAAIIGGGILGYQYLWLPKQETKPSEVKPPGETAPEEVITQPELNLNTTKLATIPEGYWIDDKDIIFSPDGKHVAIIIQIPPKEEGSFIPEKEFVIVNEKQEKPYDLVEDLEFSPDGKQLAYIACEGEIEYPRMAGRECQGEDFIVLNGEEGPRYNKIEVWTIRPRSLFSPDSKQFAYIVNKESDRDIMVINNKETGVYDAILDSIFSPNGKQFAYVSVKDGKSLFVNFNGKEGKTYERITSILTSSILTFSLDSKRIAYTAGKSGQNFIVVNGKEGKTYDIVKDLKFSSNNKQLAYVATICEKGETKYYPERCDGGKSKDFIVLNGKEGRAYDSIGEFNFSPDSNQLAYVAKKEGRGFVVINEKEGEIYDGYIGRINFGPDGKELAYVVNVEGGLGKEFIVVNGKEGKTYNNIWDYVFSPDSKKLVYIAQEGSDRLMVVNEKEGKLYNEIHDLVFSPNGNHFAYVARDSRWWGEDKEWGSKEFIVVNEKEGKPYDFVSKPIFSSDSKYVAYGARDGNELWWIVEPVE